METWGIVLSAGAVVAVIETIKELILWRQKRKAQIEDKASDKHGVYEDAIKNLSDKISAFIEADNKRYEEQERLWAEIKAQMDTICKKQDVLDEKQDAQCVTLRESLHNTIVHLADKYIKAGSIPVDEYERLKRLADAHHAIGGNGATKDLLTTLHSIIK